MTDSLRCFDDASDGSAGGRKRGVRRFLAPLLVDDPIGDRIERRDIDHLDDREISVTVDDVTPIELGRQFPIDFMNHGRAVAAKLVRLVLELDRCVDFQLVDLKPALENDVNRQEDVCFSLPNERKFASVNEGEFDEGLGCGEHGKSPNWLPVFQFTNYNCSIFNTKSQ